VGAWQTFSAALHLIARLVENAAFFGGEALHALAADFVEDVIDGGSLAFFAGLAGLADRFRASRAVSAHLFHNG
jgi:hypothetical protein